MNQLALRYGRTRILDDVNLSRPAGKITALIGPSGCGKTSFLNCLNRLIDLTPTAQVSGQIQLDDRDIQAFPVIELRRQVGMLFQKPNPFPLSIYRNIAFPLREHGVCDRPEIDAIIETALKDVGLWHEVKDRLKSPALALSGGQQQRLCLARALALKPCVILMDEPCSALDPISSEIVEDLISQLKESYTVVVVTHNLAQARRVADQV
ncbi:MAG: phosphate ABC transporter ATP-binding protein, partial [Thermosynechococcaceae cyanobacterium]